MPRRKQPGPAVTFAGSAPSAVDGLTPLLDLWLSDQTAGQAQVVVGLMSTMKRNENLDQDSYVPVVAMRHMEVATDEVDRKELAEILTRIYCRRIEQTGGQAPMAIPLPIGERYDPEANYSGDAA